MGLGRFGGGIGAARWLAAHDARVIVTDLADRAALSDSIAQLADIDLRFELGGHRADLLTDAALVVVSPAVPQERSPFFAEIVRRNVPWTTEINLFLARCPATVIGVTGSAGKSTTTAMIHAGLSASWSGGACYMGGNIGRSLLADVAEMSERDVVVLELSSFQLADLPRIARRPELAVLVNAFPHHIDRHGSFDAYVDAKLNIIRGATACTPVVIGGHDDRLIARVRDVADSFGGSIIRAGDEPPPTGLTLPGAHNADNARCATVVCRLLGLDADRTAAALREFRGLPHRLEFVGLFNGVRYYNDSKATCPTTATASLRAFDRPVIALMGGKARDVSLDLLQSAIRESARSLFCFGGGGAILADAVRLDATCGPRPVIEIAATFGEAVASACRAARDGDIVLLVPGFESYDEFPNYEHRGRAFAEIVKRFHHVND